MKIYNVRLLLAPCLWKWLNSFIENQNGTKSESKRQQICCRVVGCIPHKHTD
jgi:hypothetical protein